MSWLFLLRNCYFRLFHETKIYNANEYDIAKMAEDYNAKEEIITIDENESSYMELEYFKFFGKN